MKRILSFLLVAVMAGLLLCACVNDKPDTGGRKFSFISGKTEIYPGDEMSAVLDALGKWNAYDESPSCAFEGLDKVYKYSGFDIQTYPDGDKDYIYMITLTNDMVETPEGISVGDTRAEVIAKYGDGYTSVGENLQYEADNCVLQFIFREGRVSSIKYITNT